MAAGNPSQTTKATSWTDDPVAASMIKAFTLGWMLRELSSRLEIAKSLVNADADPATFNRVQVQAALGKPTTMIDGWFAIFNQIVVLHFSRFPNSATTGTFYEPPDGKWQSIDFLSYLFAGQDYADYTSVGIVTLTDDKGNAILSDFKLYDVTRRVLNCLGILYAISNDMVIQKIVGKYQSNLLTAVKLAPTAVKGDPTVVSSSPATQPAQAATPVKQSDQRYTEEVRAAIEKVTETAKQLLGAWAYYVLEQYRTSGDAAKDRDKATNTPAELSAYRAGRLLAGLSWQVSALNGANELKNDDKADVPELYKGWTTAFDPNTVVKAQRAVSALSSSLDACYYNLPGKTRPDPSSGPAPYDPDLPSNACEAVRRSIVFWSQSVAWVNPEGHEGDQRLTSAFAKNLRDALIRQSDIWQNLLTGKQGLGAFTIEGAVSQLVQDEANGIITEAVNEIATTSWQEANGIWRGVQDTLRRSAPAIVAGTAIFLLLGGPAIFWLVVVAHPSITSLNSNGVWALLGIAPIVAAVASWRASAGPPSTAATATPAGAAGAVSPAGPDTRLSALFAGAGALLSPIFSLLSEMVQDAFKEAQVLLADLTHAIGVASPLVDCFITATNNSVLVGKTVTDINTIGLFLTTVIWSESERQNEVEQIVQAAFDPVSILIDTHTAAVKAASSTERANVKRASQQPASQQAQAPDNKQNQQPAELSAEERERTGRMQSDPTQQNSKIEEMPPPPPPPPPPEPLPRLADGSLVREKSSPAVYVIFGGAKFHIPDPAELAALGYSGNQVQVVSDGTLANVPLIPAQGTVLRQRDQPAVYVMCSGQAVHIPTPDALTLVGLSWDSVRILPVGGMAQVPQIELPSLTPTPPSMVFGPNQDGSDPGTRWARTEIPGLLLPNGVQVVELRGWLRHTELGPRAQDPDWSLNVEVDPEWLDQTGIDPGVFAKVGDILMMGANGRGSFGAYTATPTLHVEVNGWRDSVQVGRTKPRDWKKIINLPGVTDTIWPYVPLDPSGDNTQQLDQHLGAYVRLSGSLVTDQPHNVGTLVGDLWNATVGDASPDDYKTYSLQWQEGHGLTAPDNPARWTEMHPPDLIEILPQKEQQVFLTGIAVVAHTGALDPSGVDNEVTVALAPRSPRLPHMKVAIEEHVGSETNFGTITEGNAALNGAQITLSRDTASVHVKVHGKEFAGEPGKFKAVYKLWWQEDSGPYVMTLSMTPTTYPTGQPVTVTVIAVDPDTGAPVAGQVTIDGTVAGPTNTPFTHTFQANKQLVWVGPSGSVAPPVDQLGADAAAVELDAAAGGGLPGHWVEIPAPNVVIVTAPNYVTQAYDAYPADGLSN